MTRRIDDSHTPAKRTTKFGPGPRKQKAAFRGDWECHKAKSTPTMYVQKCVYVGDNKNRLGAKITVKTKKSRKKAYNREYRKWAKKNARIKALQKRGARSGYRCRKTAVAKCRK
jgi:hypothetical protein